MAKAAGKHHHEIAHLHGCRRKNCHNITAVCIDVGDEHLGIQPHHVNQWSQAIEDGYATLQAPPPDLITKMKYATRLGANHAAQAKKKEKKHHRSSSSSSLSSSSTSHVSKKACQSSQPSIQNIYTTPAMSSMPPNDITTWMATMLPLLIQSHQQLPAPIVAQPTHLPSPYYTHPSLMNPPDSQATQVQQPIVQQPIVQQLIVQQPIVQQPISPLPIHRNIISATPNRHPPCSGQQIFSSPTASDIHPVNEKLQSFFHFLSIRYSEHTDDFDEALNILVDEVYNWQMLWEDLSTEAGHNILRGLGIKSGIVRQMKTHFQEFRKDWKQSNTAAEALSQLYAG